MVSTVQACTPRSEYEWCLLQWAVWTRSVLAADSHNSQKYACITGVGHDALWQNPVYASMDGDLRIVLVENEAIPVRDMAMPGKELQHIMVVCIRG